MYEHAIPQNIMDYEFRLFAGLTLKQFIYVAVSGGISFALFQMNRAGLFPDFFAWLTIPPILLVGLVLGLGSFGKRSAEDYLTAFFRVSNMPLRRVWKKDPKPVKFDDFFNTKPAVLPAYLAGYFIGQDEYRRLMQSQLNTTGVQQQTVVMATEQPQMLTTLDITMDNCFDYAEPSITLPIIPNTVAFRLQEDSIPLEGVVAYVKDAQGTVLTALRSNQEGILYFSQSFQNGTYEMDFQAPDGTTFPRIRITFDGNTYPLLNIAPLS